MSDSPKRQHVDPNLFGIKLDHPSVSAIGQLWVIRVILAMRWQLPVYPNEQTIQRQSSLRIRATSGLMHSSKIRASFDHLVGSGDQVRRNVEAERLGPLSR